MSSELRIDSVRRAFGAKEILTAATVWVAPGQITSVFGRNGCGKSTLLRCATGQDRWDQGTLLLDGEAVDPKLRRLARRGVFFLPATGLLSRRHSIRWHFDAIRRRYESSQESSALPVGEFLDRRPGELSVGERRRCELALVLARAPRYLLADEPFQGLAPIDRSAVADALARLRAAGTGIIATGHEVEELFDIADEVIWMTAGTTLSLGSAAQARSDERFRRAYLGG